MTQNDRKAWKSVGRIEGKLVKSRKSFFVKNLFAWEDLQGESKKTFYALFTKNKDICGKKGSNKRGHWARAWVGQWHWDFDRRVSNENGEDEDGGGGHAGEEGRHFQRAHTGSRSKDFDIKKTDAKIQKTEGKANGQLRNHGHVERQRVSNATSLFI